MAKSLLFDLADDLAKKLIIFNLFLLGNKNN